MDDLDRMFRRLVQNIRNGYPEYLTHPFEVSELYQNLIPYRHNRREMGLETNEDYEVALCRLLTGERGYLGVDESLAATVRRELATSNPNTAIFREFAASRVAITPTGARIVDAWPAEENGVVTPASLAGVTAAATPPRSWGEGSRASGTAAAAVATTPSGSAAANPGRDDACRYCGSALPAGRKVAYCPHCGQNLTIQRCPACGTELDISWKYCITCGRTVVGA